jgi:hypothetical protein
MILNKNGLAEQFRTFLQGIYIQGFTAFITARKLPRASGLLGSELRTRHIPVTYSRREIMDIQLIVAIGTLAASASIAWGIYQSKQKSLDTRMGIVEAEHKSDHDLLIRLDEKVNIILQKLDKLERQGA